MKRALLVAPVVLAAPILMACAHPHKLSVHAGSHTASYGSTAAPSAPSTPRSHSTPPAHSKPPTVSPTRPCPKPSTSTGVPSKPTTPAPPPATSPATMSPATSTPPVVPVAATTPAPVGGIGTPLAITHLKSPGPAALATTGGDDSVELGLGIGAVVLGVVVTVGAVALGRRGRRS